MWGSLYDQNLQSETLEDTCIGRQKCRPIPPTILCSCQAALLGLDLRRHAELGLRPGEVRAVALATEAPPDFSGSLSCKRPPACL